MKYKEKKKDFYNSIELFIEWKEEIEDTEETSRDSEKEKTSRDSEKEIKIKEEQKESIYARYNNVLENYEYDIDFMRKTVRVFKKNKYLLEDSTTDLDKFLQFAKES